MVLKYTEKDGASRYLSIDPIENIRVPDQATVGENQIRMNTTVRVGTWNHEGGWLVLAWSTDDAPREKHETLIERAEGSLSPLKWLTIGRVAMYWSLHGQPCRSSVRLCREAMEPIGKNLRHLLIPKRYPSAYRIQDDLVHVWVPL